MSFSHFHGGPRSNRFDIGLILILALAGVAEAGVNAFWKELAGSASGGGISKVSSTGNVSANSAQVAFGSDNLPVVAYVTGPSGDRLIGF